MVDTIVLHPYASTVLEQLKNENISIATPCSGKGLCGKCKIQIIQGKTNDLTEDEKNILSSEDICNGIRLACFTIALSTIKLNILFKYNDYNNCILSDGFKPNFTYNPYVKTKNLSINQCSPHCKHSLEDIVKNWIRLDVPLPLAILRKASSLLELHHKKAVFYKGELLDIIEGDALIYGIALDLGTTTVCFTLTNLVTFEEIDEVSFMNPQTSWGLDVLTRIQYTMEVKDGLENLHDSIIEKLNSSIKWLCCRNHININSIYEIVVAGNPTMIHSLLKLPIKTLGTSPYLNVTNSSLYLHGSSIGLKINELGKVYTLPSISSYIGGDIVAGLLSTRAHTSTGTTLFIDIGTNGEIALCHNGKIICCSCASGPALEGMNISCGMPALLGAIDSASLIDETLHFTTIGSAMPKGICGSGLLDIIAALIKADALGSNGRLKINSPLVEELQGKRVVYLIKGDNPIYICQSDIRQVQLAKGAILSGILALLQYSNISVSSIGRVIVAGQFGAHLSKDSLKAIGMFPSELIDKIYYSGNSSKSGALLCLLSKEERDQCQVISNCAKYIELSNLDGYENLFYKCLMFN